ncbi:hypothetical protein [Parvicella tangerina]|uniref:Uncharacterized protein n=1 Tax=Parvicella tangerina TaxID=2829795 RepID=A0A916JQN6_9FLAO|nr:hypothetical protein [Parvicella tangerina]CAG5087185.1 hypothetical protein CRYO30217_03409 [Parvicella tangerina]
MENEDEVLEFDLNSTKKERTGLLTTACVLSWIMGGLMVLATGAMMLMKSFFFENIMKEAYAEMDALQRAQMDMLAENFNNIFLFNLVAYSVSIFAVILMYRLKKIGFYIYAPLHILMVVYPYLTYSPFQMDSGFIFNVAILGAFLAFYGVNLKHMD